MRRKDVIYLQEEDEEVLEKFQHYAHMTFFLTFSADLDGAVGSSSDSLVTATRGTSHTKMTFLLIPPEWKDPPDPALTSPTHALQRCDRGKRGHIPQLFMCETSAENNGIKLFSASSSKNRAGRVLLYCFDTFPLVTHFIFNESGKPELEHSEPGVEHVVVTVVDLQAVAFVCFLFSRTFTELNKNFKKLPTHYSPMLVIFVVRVMRKTLDLDTLIQSQ
ncbi:hypothetical protein JOB18_012710 [Solea senegalensis]|uniref:Uncharacterized protein n=1 Tax=Solea senegalensis TaxID=28829 RepID=A0AAV6RDP5_SOLSE|nr:hypothetical protein JOB18_012710 [Solea senegalensis]